MISTAAGSRRLVLEPTASVGQLKQRGLVDYDAINRLQACIVLSEVDVHASAGTDRAFDHFASAIEDVPARFKNIHSRAVLANDDGAERLIACRRSSFDPLVGIGCGHGHGSFCNCPL